MTFRADFEHRDALIGAALDEFSEHGYDAASVNQILAAAGMSKGQLYHHFANKEALYLALVEWTIDEKVRWHSEGHPLRVPDDFFDVIEANITASIGFAQARPEVERFARSLLAERGRPIFDTVTTRVGFDPNDSIGMLVAQHHAAGGFRPGLSLGFVTNVVVLVVNHLPELLDLRTPADLEPPLSELVAWLRHSLGRG